MPALCNITCRRLSRSSRVRQSSKTLDSEGQLHQLLSGRKPDRAPVFLHGAIEHMGAACTIADNVKPGTLQNGALSSVYTAHGTSIDNGRQTSLGFVLLPGYSRAP